ncbi:hypothetical protein ACHAWF_006808 [Thalassiosira exigua]
MGGDDSDEFEQGGDELNYFPPLVHHKFGCVDAGKWTGSCDIDLNDPQTGKQYTILAKADWSTECDPLKAEQQLGTLNYTEGEGWVDATSGELVVGWTNAKTPNWTCPEEERNPSGCGDFRSDTRSLECPRRQSLFNCGRPNNADSRVMRFGELPALDVPQRHVCVQHPIFYDNINDANNKNIPPALGRHRERWAKWGEYGFLPPQRWLHNAEHGGAIFLYHPCLDEESKCALRRLVQKWQDKIGTIKWPGDSEIDKFVPDAKDDEDKFRFILTPYKNLWNPVTIILWGNIYSTMCFNEAEMDEFIASNYRHAFEDWPPNGAYNYLWESIASNAEDCPALPPTPPSTTVSAESDSYANSDAVKDLAAHVEALEQEIVTLKAAKASSGVISLPRENVLATLLLAMVGVTSVLVAALTKIWNPKGCLPGLSRA